MNWLSDFLSILIQINRFLDGLIIAIFLYLRLLVHSTIIIRLLMAFGSALTIDALIFVILIIFIIEL